MERPVPLDLEYHLLCDPERPVLPRHLHRVGDLPGVDRTRLLFFLLQSEGRNFAPTDPSLRGRHTNGESVETLGPGVSAPWRLVWHCTRVEPRLRVPSPAGRNVEGPDSGIGSNRGRGPVDKDEVFRGDRSWSRRKSGSTAPVPVFIGDSVYLGTPSFWFTVQTVCAVVQPPYPEFRPGTVRVCTRRARRSEVWVSECPERVSVPRPLPPFDD